MSEPGILNTTNNDIVWYNLDKDTFNDSVSQIISQAKIICFRDEQANSTSSSMQTRFSKKVIPWYIKKCSFYTDNSVETLPYAISCSHDFYIVRRTVYLRC